MQENTVVGFCLPTELKILEDLASTVPEDGFIVELGSLFGRTAVAWATYCPSATILCIDDFKDNNWSDLAYPGVVCRPVNNMDYNTYDIFLENTKEYSNIKHMKCKCPEGIVYGGDPIDLLFVDLCHVNPIDWDTIEIFLPYVKPGGIICGHDYVPDLFPDVVENVARLEKLYNTKATIYSENWNTLWSLRI